MESRTISEEVPTMKRRSVSGRTINDSHAFLLPTASHTYAIKLPLDIKNYSVK